MRRASQESFCRCCNLRRFCQMRKAAISPPMMAMTYNHVTEKSIPLFVLGDGQLQSGKRRSDFDLARQARVLAMVRKLAQQVALVGHRRGQLVGPGRIDVD